VSDLFHPDAGALTLKAVVADYLRAAARRYQKHGEQTTELRNQTRVLDLYFCDFAPAPGRRLGDLAPAELTTDDVEAFVHWLATLPGRGWKVRPSKNVAGVKNPITVGTVNKYRCYVVLMLKWAHKRRKVSRDVLREAEDAERIVPGQTNARTTGKVAPIADEVIVALYTYCRRYARELLQGKLDNAKRAGMGKARQWSRAWLLTAIAIELHRELGCRPEELVTLSLGQVHCLPPREDGKHPGRLYRPTSFKTEHKGGVREMWVSPRGCELIDEAAGIAGTDYGQQLLVFKSKLGPDDRLFQWKSDNVGHAVSAYSTQIGRAAERAGLPTGSANQIRHSFAEWGIKRNPELTRRQMGHASIETTMRYVADDVSDVAGLWDEADATLPPPAPDPAPDPEPPAVVASVDPDHQLRLVGT